MTAKIAFASPKGGVGKSTASIAVTAELLQRGRSVLLVDADPQRSATTWAEAAEANGQPRPTVVSMGASMHAGDLERVSRDFDFAVVDCPPALADVLRSAVLAADLVVLPTTPSGFDLWALAEGVEMVKRAAALKPGLAAGILVNRRDPRSKLDANVRQVLAQAEVTVLDSMFSNLVAYREAILAGQGPSTYDPDSKAATEVRNLVDELELALGFQKKEVLRAVGE